MKSDCEKNIEKLNLLVNKALDQLYENDYHLILNRPSTDINNHYHACERSIVFRFAHYLQNLIDQDGSFADYNLDCEYNRNGAETKKLPSFPNGTYPDVIIHKRGRNDYNLLVMEFKTYWNTNQFNDKWKICQFTESAGQYAFLYGITVLIGRRRNAVELKAYVDGNRYVIDTLDR